MFFNSFIFLVFMGLVLPIFYLLRSRRLRTIHLLAASYLFYGYWDWRFCGLLAISTIVDFFIGWKLHQTAGESGRKSLLLLSMAVNLGILGCFKYFNFFVDSIEAVVATFGGHVDYLHLNVILPVGISFYTFQTMSYTIDIYRRRMEPTRSFVDFALFVSFFPQLVAGPIERARALLPQIAQLSGPTKFQLQSGLVLITMGYLRKVLIGDTSGRIVDHIFGQDELYRSPELLIGLILFGVQIYADFSGYSSIARGLARMLGIELMKNFEQPYLSTNITEFWRRWHISLSSWLKDYLYIGLGGNRGASWKTYSNLMVTMLLGGLWHGASWNFVVWGALHGIYLAIHKLMLRNRKVPGSYHYSGPGSLVRYLGGFIATNLLVSVAWLFFRADSLAQAGRFLDSFIHWETSDLAGRFFVIGFVFVVAVLILDVLEYRSGSHTFLLKSGSGARTLGICTGIMIFVLLYMATSTPLPFVYFQF